MRKNLNVIAAYSIMMGLIILVGIFQSWNIALSIFNLCLISAVMTMGANIQWGYAGLINFGIMGYTALGGLAAVLISVNPVQEAWSAGGSNILFSLFLIIGMVLAVRYVLKKYEKSKIRTYIIATIGGALYGLDKSFKPFTYFNNMLPIFAAAIVGGIGNPFGAFLGGYVIAFSEILLTYAYRKFFMYVLPETMEPDGLVQLLSTDYKFAVSFSILVIVLLYRPSGIFKGKIL